MLEKRKGPEYGVIEVLLRSAFMQGGSEPKFCFEADGFRDLDQLGIHDHVFRNVGSPPVYAKVGSFVDPGPACRLMEIKRTPTGF